MDFLEILGEEQGQIQMEALVSVDSIWASRPRDKASRQAVADELAKQVWKCAHYRFTYAMPSLF